MKKKCNVPISFIYWGDNKLLWISFQVFNEFFCWSTFFWNFEDVLLETFVIFSSSLSITLLFMPWVLIYLCHLCLSCINKIIELISYNRLGFFSRNVIFCLYLGPLVDDFLNVLFFTIRKSQIAKYWWSFFIKLESAQFHGKMKLS